MLEIVQLSKIETQLMCHFQLIIGWPIFWIYYQGRQSSRSLVKVKSNVKFDQNLAPLCHLLPSICVLKHGLRSWVVCGCPLIIQRQGHVSESRLKWSMKKPNASKIDRCLSLKNAGMFICARNHQFGTYDLWYVFIKSWYRMHLLEWVNTL